MKKPMEGADRDRQREHERKQADEHREEIVQEGIDGEEGPRQLAMDAVKKMTDGQGAEDDPEASLEEIVGQPLSIHEADEEIAHSDSEPEDAQAEPFPRVLGDGP
jgi:hypothetical protein